MEEGAASSQDPSAPAARPTGSLLPSPTLSTCVLGSARPPPPWALVHLSPFLPHPKPHVSECLQLLFLEGTVALSTSLLLSPGPVSPASSEPHVQVPTDGGAFPAHGPAVQPVL